MQEIQVWYLGQEDSLKKEMAALSGILAWENPTDSGAWWAIVHGVVKGQTRLSTAGGRAYMVNDFFFLQEVAFTNKNSELFAHWVGENVSSLVPYF